MLRGVSVVSHQLSHCTIVESEVDPSPIPSSHPNSELT